MVQFQQQIRFVQATEYWMVFTLDSNGIQHQELDVLPQQSREIWLWHDNSWHPACVTVQSTAAALQLAIDRSLCRFGTM